MEIPRFATPTATPHGADSGVVRNWRERVVEIIKQGEILEKT